MYLNSFSDGLEPLDMSGLDEYRSLCDSARDLGIEAPEAIRYLSHNTVFNHQRFHFLEWGEPKDQSIVLLHGGNQSCHAWDLVSLNLAINYHVLALDQRGHGDSEWSRGAHYAIEDMRGDAEAFVDLVSAGERPVLVGHSMGGMVSLALAVNQPNLIKALVIIDIGPEVNEEGAGMIRNFVGRNIEFDDMEEFLDRVEKYDTYRTREHIRRTLKYNLIRRADGRYVSKSDRRRYAIAESKGHLPFAPSLDAIRHLDMPVLIVRGEDSNVLTADAANRFVSALPQGRLVTVPGAGHNVASQNTTGFLAVLHEFLGSLG